MGSVVSGEKLGAMLAWSAERQSLMRDNASNKEHYEQNCAFAERGRETKTCLEL